MAENLKFTRGFTKGNFEFQLDGHPAPGYVKSVTGGLASAAVMSELIGPDHVAFKHIGAPKIEPIKLELGMSLSGMMIDWIRSSWSRDFQRKSGAIIHADADTTMRLEQQFHDALITETKFPALGTAESAYLEVTLQPERIDIARASRQMTRGVGSTQSEYTTREFRFVLDDGDLAEDCAYVTKIDSFSVKQTVKELYFGRERFPELEPTGLEFGDINIEIDAEHTQGFRKWYDKLVLKGGRETVDQRTGSIVYLSQNGEKELLTISLDGVGIHSYAVDKNETAKGLLNAKIGLHVDSMDIKL